VSQNSPVARSSFVAASVQKVPRAEGDAFSYAVAVLYHAQFESLFRYLDRLTDDLDLAKDLAQETFVRLYGRGAMPDDPRAWLAAVATNLFRDHRRRTRRRAELVAEYAADAAPSDQSPPADATVMAREARVQARVALDSLCRRDRALLLLHHEGYSYRELAHAVGVAESSVGTLLVRATRMFRAAVSAELLRPGGNANIGRRGHHASD
jgi:RNA polymerase sigma-70 factor, ECF subfamily